MSDDHDSGSYSVGYGKPPKTWQFRPGRSGNPKGRPRKVRAEPPTGLLDQPVAVREGDTVVQMHPKELAFRQQLKKGLQDGDVAALKHLLDQMERFDERGSDTAEPLGGVLELSDRAMPFEMQLILATRFGMGPWTAAQLAAARAEYVSSRSSVQAKIDAAIGYPALKEDA